MDSVEVLADRSKAALSVEFHQETQPKRIALLTLSQELGDSGYDHLLLIDRFEIFDNWKLSSRFDPSILGVSQALYNEA